MTLYGVMGYSALVLSQPIITVRYANPQYNCNTNVYCLDVEFQSNTANQELFGMNVRFFYDDNVLELNGFSGFANNYSAVVPNPPNNSQSTLAFGQSFFTFTGAADYINGAVERTSAGTPLYISTTGWTRIFSICFTVNGNYPSQQNFCPPVVWDLEQNPANGGFFGTSQGVVLTVAAGGNTSAPATANVDQYNWTYGPPGNYGHPIVESCINIECTLPVSLLSFTGFHNETGNHLKWQTVAEINNYGFEVQRSLDGIQWEILGFVNASTSGQQTKHYSFADYKPLSGKNLYRLKQIDQDGIFQYSSIVRIDAGIGKKSNEIVVYPNPVSDGIFTVSLPQSDWELSSVNLFSSTGHLIKEYAKEGLTFEMEVNKLPSGMYLLRVTRGDEVLFKKIIVE